MRRVVKQFFFICTELAASNRPRSILLNAFLSNKNNVHMYVFHLCLLYFYLNLILVFGLMATSTLNSLAPSTTLALLTQFEHQYSVSTADITAKIGQLQHLSSSEFAQLAKEVRQLLADVEELLEQMELSAREIPPNSLERAKYETRVKSYRNDKSQLDAELRKAVERTKSNADREELFQCGDGAVSIDQMDKLISNTERMERTSRKIDDAYRVTVETEQIGAEVLENLGQQRETLTRARGRMRDADSDLSRSNRVLSQMIRRVIQNRLILLGVAVVMMFSLLFLLYKAL